MFNMQQDALVTISPNYHMPQCGATRFRWHMNIALPFPMPVEKCIHKTVIAEEKEYSFSIHNHLDRIHRYPNNSNGIPQVFLGQKLQDGEKEKPEPKQCHRVREPLQAVAVFTSNEESPSPTEAFVGAEKRIKECFSELAGYLGQFQRSLPYMHAWTVYPVTIFDVGVIHHGVDHFCPEPNRWLLQGSGVAMSVARQLKVPLFTVDPEETTQLDPAVDLANGLLAEAQMALFRRLLRLTVLNSCAAVEGLANHVYKQKRLAQLAGDGMNQSEAEELAETDRRQHRTDEKFLLHKGMKDACEHSLFEEKKDLYDEFLRWEEIRHQTAHAGLTPTKEDAESCFKICCDVVSWLCHLAGYSAKPIQPTRVIPGFAASTDNQHTCSPAELETLRRMFGILSANPNDNNVNPQNEHPIDQ